MTKRDARKFKEEWNRARIEGRMVRYNNGLSFRSFPTVKQAQDFIIQTVRAGMTAGIVEAR